MTMMKWEQERWGWVKTLKEGDEVAYNIGRYGKERWVIGRVKKITTTGKIRIDDGTLFDEKGEHRSGTGWNRIYRTIQPVTQEILDSIRREKILYDLSHVKFEKLPLEKLEEIMKILG